MNNSITQAKEIIAKADAILIMSGAGMGVDSGLPDYRSKEGFWKAYPPLRSFNYLYTQMATPEVFFNMPKLAWAFYGHRLALYRDTTAHEGFLHLKKWCDEKSAGYFLFTSNVDGQFQKAGFNVNKICEIHGSIHHLQCLEGCTSEVWDNELEIEDLAINMDILQVNNLPKCPYCDAIVRPNIVMFGDGGFKYERYFVQNDRFERWLHKTAGMKIAIIEIGAGTEIPTVRQMSDKLSSMNKETTLIRINPQASEVSNPGDIALKMGGLAALELINRA
jgi:NAD-dependent SIR2 family protein deacetylase